MKRASHLLGIVILCGLLGVGAVTLAIQVAVPNYYHESGSPPVIIGGFLGCPLGLVVGLVLAAVFSSRRHK